MNEGASESTRTIDVVGQRKVLGILEEKLFLGMKCPTEIADRNLSYKTGLKSGSERGGSRERDVLQKVLIDRRMAKWSW